MKSFGIAVLSLVILPLFIANGSAAPVLPGLSSKHSLSENQIGQLLIGELRCAACHTQTNAPPTPERMAPDLSDVGSRLTPDYLRKFIASPSAAHAGTTMPDLLAREADGQRDAIAEAITHFLVAQSPHGFKREQVPENDRPLGQSLFHSIGCIACHSPRDESGKEIKREGAVELVHIPAKYRMASLEEFLFQPTRVRPSGRMPDMKLTPVEAKAIASYLLGNGGAHSQPLQPQEKLVALGRKHFQELNCAACHKLGDGPKPTLASPLRDLNPMRGCLSDTPGKSPRFNLSEDQTRAIRSSLLHANDPITDKSKLALTLAAFNCIACHVRDNSGGVSEENNPLFQTTEKELGDEARIPPPLTLVGAKLQPIALKKILFDSDTVRPYMLTRMPQFGESNLRGLPELFARLDAVKGIEFSLPTSESNNKKERDREKELRAAGRELVGDKALNCVACHTFNNKSPNKKGIDLMSFNARLQPAWFYRFMIDPSAFRPRTVMPTSWPGGKAVHKTILNGDTDRQLEAIWYFLSLGTSAPDPSGIQTAQTLLSVTDVARTYRGRSSVAGFRGIAVGFPEKLNYAFNAETGTLTAIWRGDYVKVDRSGQGSGAFQPASPFVALAQDVSFFALADELTPWPLRPTMTKDAPVNPDPLYPKNRGYQFKGYYLDDASVPTFLYRSNDLEIEDRSAAATVEKKVKLIRTLTFNAPKDQTIWFRALTGKVEADSKQQYKTPNLRLSIPAVHALVRPNSADQKATELLLKLEIPNGKSSLTFTYELLP